MLQALDFLRQSESLRHPDMHQAPLEFVPGAWRRVVVPPRQTAVDRRAYTLCAMERLQDSLRRRDVCVARSERWGDPRLQLLHGEQWETIRPQVCRALGRHERFEPELQTLTQQLDAASQNTAATFPTNAAAASNK